MKTLEPQNRLHQSRLSDLPAAATTEIPLALRILLADAFTLYLKTKSFHWHMSGPHFRDYHRLLDEQAAQILEMTDAIAERARKLGGATLRSIGDIAAHQRLLDNEEGGLSAEEMLGELLGDNQTLTRHLRALHESCDRHRDLATASLIENWIDEAETRSWFLHETLHDSH